MLGFRLTALKRSIFAKFVVSFLLAGILPLSALGYFLMNAYFAQSERFNLNNLEQMTFYLTQNTGQLLNNYNEISKSMYDANGYPDLSQAARGNQIPVIDNWLSYVISSNPYIENAYFVPQSSREVLSRSRRAKSFDAAKFPLAELTRELKQNPKGIQMSPAHGEAYFSSSNRQVVTFSRYLLDTSTLLDDHLTVLGVFLFDVNIEVFDELISGLELEANDKIIVTDTFGKVMYSNNRMLIGQTQTVEMAQKEGEKRNAQLIVRRIAGTNQLLIGSYSRSGFLAQLTRFKVLVVLIVSVCLLLLTLLSLGLSRRFSQPIRDIKRKLARMESGDLDGALPVRSPDEIGQLTRGVNRMSDQLGRFIQEAYVAEIRQKQSELNALKSQIRPHYLYNTLEVIRMSAVSRDDEPVADMIHALSNQLAYVLDYGKSLVTIGEELANVRDYFHLIQVRYEELASLEIQLAPGIQEEWGILKLSVQPLVENAVQHGILPKESAGHVRLEISLEEPDVLSICVIDDGIGMDERQTDELSRRLGHRERPEDSGKPASVGLKNVHDRLQSLYGSSFGLSFDSYPLLGTSVQIRMPVIRAVDDTPGSGN